MTYYIGHQNHLEAGTVTVTSEVAGFEKENAYDWILSDGWKAGAAGTVRLTVDMGAPVSANYWAIAGHDLHDNNGTIRAQYSSDNFAADINDFDTIYAPTDGNPYGRVVTARTARYLGFLMSSTTLASVIGQLSIGQVLELPNGMPVGFTPTSIANMDDVSGNISETGQFIGRSVKREGKEFTITQEAVTPAWILANWPGLYSHVIKKPFFFLSVDEGFSDDTVFCWTDGKIQMPRYKTPVYMTFNIKVNGK